MRIYPYKLIQRWSNWVQKELIFAKNKSNTKLTSIAIIIHQELSISFLFSWDVDDISELSQINLWLILNSLMNLNIQK